MPVSKSCIFRYCTIRNSENIRKHYQHPPIQICPHNNIFPVSPSLSPALATASSESKRIRPSGATSLTKPRADVLKGHLNRFQVLLGCYLLGHGVKKKTRSRTAGFGNMFPLFFGVPAIFHPLPLTYKAYKVLQAMSCEMKSLATSSRWSRRHLVAKR